MSFSDEQAQRLAAPLDAKRIKQRAAGNGNKLSYIETHDAIRTANEIFGFGKWGHRVENLNYLGSAPVKNLNTGKEGIHIGYLCTVALSVEGCAVTSGIGYGDATEYRPTAHVTAHELAAKEAESDALKRALKNYGDQFGLALYAKDALTAGHIGSAGTSGTATPTGAGSNGAPADKPPTPAFQPPPTKPTRGLPEGHVLAANVKIGFGKNSEKHISDLTEKSAQWYAEFDPTSEHARLVKRAAIAYLEDKTATVAVEDEVPF